MSVATTGFSPIFRLVSPTVNVKHGTLNANAKFVTNLPFDYAMFIDKVEWGIAVKDAEGVANADWQVTCELTEFLSATTASNTDPLLIDTAFYEERIQIISGSTSGAWGSFRNPFNENKKNFDVEFGSPYATVAANLNVIATMVELVGSGPPTNGVDVFCNIFYRIAPITPALRDYLAKRQQLQR